MANNNKPLPQDVIEYVAQFPAWVLAKVRRHSIGGFIATVDIRDWYVSDADMPEYAATAEEACAKIKAHLIDDLSCGGRWGKRHYQPHWDSYDLRYRLGSYWEEKLAGLQQHEIDAQVESAMQTKMRHGYTEDCVVCKKWGDGDRTFLGFHFEPDRHIGYVGKHQDGTNYMVLAVI